VASHGAGLTNILFFERLAVVELLPPTYVKPCFHRLGASRRAGDHRSSGRSRCRRTSSPTRFAADLGRRCEAVDVADLRSDAFNQDLRQVRTAPAAA
jgi:hypothetical protein